MTPSSDAQQNDLDEDGWGQPDPGDAEAAVDVAELAELGEAAATLRRRIKSPELDAHPFPQEVTLLMVAGLLENIGHAGPTPTTDQQRAVVDAALEIAHHVRRSSPSS
jgi:hypothetical protein